MDAIEKRARELLAKVHADADWTGLANEIRLNATFDIDHGLALAAIRAALTPPEGYALVPVEPTDDMLGDGAESKPMRPFTPLDEMEAFEEMTGCEQARHVAKLCWAAMLAARPEVP